MPNTYTPLPALTDYSALYRTVAQSSCDAVTNPIRLLIAAYVADHYIKPTDDRATFNKACSYAERLWLLTTSTDILFIENCVDMFFDNPDTFLSATTSKDLYDLVEAVNNSL